MSAYERAKHVLPERLTEETSARLMEAINSVCIDAQVLALWHASLTAAASGHGSGEVLHEREVEQLVAALCVAGQFLECVVVELVGRDLAGLLEFHLSSCAKTLTAPEWEHAQQAHAYAHAGPDPLAEAAASAMSSLTTAADALASGALEALAGDEPCIIGGEGDDEDGTLEFMVP